MTETRPIKISRRNNKGFTLTTSIILLVFASTAVLSVTTFIIQRFLQIETRRAGTKAIYLAQAGLHKAMWYLLDTAPDGTKNGSWRTTAYPAPPGPNPTDPKQESLAGGTYTLWVENSGSNILITARGETGNIRRTIQQTAVLTPAGHPGYKYGQYTDGNVIYTGSTGVINGDLKMSGNFVGGGGMTINGTVTEKASGITIPTVDFAAYQGIANSVINNNHTFSAGTYSGIWYINGNVTIQSNVTINGSIIATGSINMMNRSNITLNPDMSQFDYPALVTQSNLNGDGLINSSITGSVYALGNMKFNNNLNVTYNIAMMGTGNVEIKNGSGYIFNFQIFLPPYFEGASLGANFSVSNMSEL